MENTNPILDPLNGAVARFPAEQLQELEQWFDENAEPLLVVNDGPPIDVVTVPLFLKLLALKKFHVRHFHYPTKAEIAEELEKMHTKDLMTKEIFLYMLDKYVKVPDLKHELNLAFKVFDMEKNNLLDIGELKVVLTTYDEQLDPSELQEFLRDANVKGSGIVDYKDFVDRMFAICPELINLESKFLYENPDDDPSVEPLTRILTQDEIDFMNILMDEDGVPEDETKHENSKEENETDITEVNTEINQPNDKQENPDLGVILLDEESDFPDHSTVAKSEYSDVTTENPLESVKNDDQGYDGDIDDLAFANR